MAQILEMKTPEQARAAAENVIKKAQEQTVEKHNVIENVLKEIEQVNPELGGFDEIATLLAMSDEHFAIIAPVFLEELERSYNNVNDQLALVQAMNVAGIRAEDMQVEYLKICEEIDTQLMNALSFPKRDFLKRLLGLTYNAVAAAEGISKRNILIPIELCHPDAKMPTYAHATDAGMDVYALDDITIAPGETVLVPTGLKVAIPAGYELQVRPKSGRSVNTKLRIANTPGTIDSGYRDEIKIIVENIAPFIKHAEPTYDGGFDSVLYGSSYTIGKGEKFAQLVLSEVPKALFYQVGNIEEIPNDGRNGGFGSTGVK